MKLFRKKVHGTKNNSLPKQTLEALRQSGRFIGIKIDRCSCSVGAKIAGDIFLFPSAPSLPLNGCNLPDCTCQYLGVPERRQVLERRSISDRRQAIRMEAVERRLWQDRRMGADIWKGLDQ